MALKNSATDKSQQREKHTADHNNNWSDLLMAYKIQYIHNEGSP